MFLISWTSPRHYLRFLRSTQSLEILFKKPCQQLIKKFSMKTTQYVTYCAKCRYKVQDFIVDSFLEPARFQSAANKKQNLSLILLLRATRFT